MRILLLFVLTMILMPAMAQKSAGQTDRVPCGIRSGKVPTDTLWPGDAMPASEFVLISDTNGGYVLGTNSFHDVCKGQQFHVDTSYALEGALFWFGAKKIIQNADSLEFFVWGMDSLQGYTMNGGNQPCPGTVVTSVVVPMDAVDTGSSLQDAFPVTFPAPVYIGWDYVIGFDMSKMVDDSLGLMSTSNGSGNGNELVWEKWSNGTWHTLQASGWGLPALLDIDAMILPVVDMTSAGIIKSPMVDGMMCWVAPNPASAGMNLMITLQAPSSRNCIELINVAGKCVFKQNAVTLDKGLNMLSVDVTSFPAGNYYCIFRSEQGSHAVKISVAR